MRLPTCFLVMLSGGLLACSGAQPAGNTDATEITVAASQPPIPTGPLLNMPTLAGLSIDQLRQQLGKPQESQPEPTQRQKMLGTGDTWENTFLTKGSTLVVTFNARTRTVRDIVVLGDNEAELMRRGGLNQNAAEYIVLLVTDSLDVTRTTGLRMVPKK